MITNERQYRITRAQLDKIKRTIEVFDMKEITRRLESKILAKAEFDALQSELENLTAQAQEYETLKSGSVEILKASTLEELPNILIRARIAKGLSQRKLAELLGLKEQQIQKYEAEEYATANLNRIAEVANALQLNISEVAEFKKLQKPIEDRTEDLAWDEFPIKEMYVRNWFEDFSGSLKMAIDNAEELVKDFIIKSIGEPIRVATRQRMRLGGYVNKYALLAWQCRLINLAKEKGRENEFKIKEITDKMLADLAELSCKTDGPREAVAYLQRYGIPLIIVPHLPNTYLDGAAILLSDGPVIGMTLRYDRLDNFWFVLFHELAHIKKHLSKGRIEAIFDDLEESADEMEREADEYSGEILIPKDEWEISLARYTRSKESIIEFAKKIKRNSAIVAGKIRREAENYTILTDMVGQGEVRKLFPEVDFSY
jgi:HTH-type transcriptional regulator/antitoxin HigA